MLAIGIDPGTAICGFGLVEMVGNKLTPIHYGAVFTDKDMLPELRLKKIYDELLSLIHISEPTRLGMISYAVFCLKKKNTSPSPRN